MGTNLFYYLLDFGFKLIWICHPSANIDKIRNTFEKKIKRSFDNGLMDEQHVTFLLNSIVISSDPTVLSPCDLIIEAISEDLELKKELFRAIDPVVSRNCILASNSSSIRPSELIPSESRKDKFIGIHFFYPIALKNIVEFITTADTSRKTKDFVKNFLYIIKRNWLLLNEKNSFILKSELGKAGPGRWRTCGGRGHKYSRFWTAGRSPLCHQRRFAARWPLSPRPD